jgi:hypothetical protein
MQARTVQVFALRAFASHSDILRKCSTPAAKHTHEHTAIRIARKQRQPDLGLDRDAYCGNSR